MEPTTKKFGTIAIELGYASQEQITEALNYQALLQSKGGKHLRLGKILRNHKILTADQVRTILAQQGKQPRKSKSGSRDPNAPKRKSSTSRQRQTGRAPNASERKSSTSSRQRQTDQAPNASERKSSTSRQRQTGRATAKGKRGRRRRPSRSARGRLLKTAVVNKDDPQVAGKKGPARNSQACQATHTRLTSPMADATAEQFEQYCTEALAQVQTTPQAKTHTNWQDRFPARPQRRWSYGWLLLLGLPLALWLLLPQRTKSPAARSATPPHQVIPPSHQPPKEVSTAPGTSQPPKRPSVRPTPRPDPGKQFIVKLMRRLRHPRPPSQRYLNEIIKHIFFQGRAYLQAPSAGDIYNLNGRLYFYKIHLDQGPQLFDSSWKAKWLAAAVESFQQAREAYQAPGARTYLSLLLMPWMPEKQWESGKSFIHYDSPATALRDVEQWLARLRAADK